MQKSHKHSDEAREKLRQSSFTRDNRPRIQALPKGEKHWNWNDNPSVLTLHRRIHRKHGAAKKHPCSKCKEKQAHDWANVTGKYTANVEDYAPMCRSCHVKLDKNWIKKSTK